MDNLVMFIILLVLSFANGYIGYRNQKEGKPSAFSWFVSGWCGFAALTYLGKLIVFIMVNGNT